METKDHIKFYLNITSFIILFSLCCLVITFIMRPLTYNAYNIAGFYAEEKNSLDVVYIGGSACFTYWMPIEGYKNAGFTSYNYAVDTLPPEAYRFFASEVKKYQNPELIIFDARAFQWRKNNKTSRNISEVAYRNATTYMQYGVERSLIINKLIPKYLESLEPSQDLATYHFDIAKYHGRREQLNIKNSLQMMFNLYKNPSHGFLFVDEIKTITKEATPNITDTAPIDTEEMLRELLEYLKDNNQKALFVISPYAETIEEKKEINTIAKIIKEAGFDFVDANDYADLIGINYSRDFYNSQHANPSGAFKYSTFLSEYIKTHYNLKDRRGQNPTWDNYIEPWSTALKNRLQALEEK